jgi:DNA-binding YbaB/EbfC family protein
MAQHSPGTRIDIPRILANAAAVQSEMQDAQLRLKESEVEGTPGGGMVRIRLGGDLLVRQVVIDPSALEVEDVELVGEAVQAAMNQAIRAAQDLASSVLGGITAGGHFSEGL